MIIKINLSASTYISLKFYILQHYFTFYLLLQSDNNLNSSCNCQDQSFSLNLHQSKIQHFAISFYSLYILQSHCFLLLLHIQQLNVISHHYFTSFNKHLIMMFKKKFKATLIDKDATTNIMYHTSQAMKLENDNCTIFISNNEKMTQKADLAEHQSIRSIIFWVKIVFKINEVVKSVIDAFDSLNESLYVTCKIVMKILMNWTFSICFDIKLH